MNPVHEGIYLAKKLLEVIDWLNITYTIILVIRDNTSLNNTILNEFKAIIAK